MSIDKHSKIDIIMYSCSCGDQKRVIIKPSNTCTVIVYSCLYNYIVYVVFISLFYKRRY